MREKTQLLMSRIQGIVEHKHFFSFIILLVVVQGLWYAFSFAPLLFDEAKHFKFVSVYIEHPYPLITEQDPKWGSLGDVTRDGSYLFYYLMSIPLRVVMLFTDNPAVQLIVLRCINILIFVGGLYMLRKALLTARISPSIIHVALLLFIVTPAFALLPGVLTYDIPSFALFAVILKIAFDIIRSNKFELASLVMLLAVSSLMSVIKFSNVVAIIPVVIFVAAIYLKRYKYKNGSFRKALSAAFNSMKLTTKIGLVLVSIFAVALVVERPITNIITYHSPAPDCTSIHSEASCYKDYVSKRNQDFIAAKPSGFKPMNPFEFLNIHFIPGMVKTMSQQWPFRGPLPIMYLMVYSFFYILALSIVANISAILRNKYLTLLLLASVFYTVILFLQLYSSYIKLGQPAAISGRYLMIVVPVFLVLGLVSINKLFLGKVSRLTTFGVGAVALVLLTQGGGITTHLLSVNDINYYWRNEKVREINNSVKLRLQNYVKE